jgi:hypothetical protein
VIESFANDLTATDDDTPMAVVQRGLLGLDEAEGFVGILAGRHLGCGWLAGFVKENRREAESVLDLVLDLWNSWGLCVLFGVLFD